MLLEALIAVGDLGRLREIAVVLVEHGFGDFVQRTGIRRALARAGQALHLRKAGPLPADVSTACRARQALEALGPTFVKLGQLLASRPDLLPPDWIEELSTLHAHVTAVPYEEIREQIETDLGMLPERAFATFSREALAAGSIAQVYAATLHDGREVVVKVRRPDIAERVAADLRLLARVAQILQQEDSDIRRFRPRQIVRDFTRMMRSELDLRTEAQNLSRITRNLGERDDLVLPVEIETWTRERMLVMTRVPGLSAADWLAGKRDERVDPAGLASAGAQIVMQMVFGDGIYHADPHPGNLVFLSDGRVGLLDFGQVGRLSDARRLELVKLIGAVIDRNEEAAVDVLLDWAEGGSPDQYELTADVRAFVDRYDGVPLDQLDVAGMLLDVTSIVRENDLALPSEVAMLIKVFLTLEGLGTALDPQFRLTDQIDPAARDLLRRTTSPRAILRRGIRDTRAMLRQLPTDLRALVTKARRGQFRLEMDLQRLDRFGSQLERSANRITMGMITASLIIGTAIAMTAQRGPTLWGWPALGLFGFLCSAGVGVLLLWSIWRSQRP